MFSDSAEFLTTHRRTVSQSTGRCASSRQVKQKAAPQAQPTSRAAPPAPAAPAASTACSHPGAGHQAARRLSSTKDRSSNWAYLARAGGGATASMTATGTAAKQSGRGQRRPRAAGPASTAAATYPAQQSVQKAWPHRAARVEAAGTASKQMPQVTGSGGGPGADGASTRPHRARTASVSANHSSCTRGTSLKKKRGIGEGGGA